MTAREEFVALSGRCRDWKASTGLITGSGLGAVCDEWEIVETVPYAEVEGIETCGVEGHRGEFVRARVAGKELIVARGRLHLYEGHSAQTVAAPVRAMAALGIETLILTNAAGSLNRAYEPGQWMALTDHLNLTGESPLAGRPAFIDMSEVYDHALRARLHHESRRLGITLREGVYAGVKGPQYETPAEVRMLERMGGDAVGMSTVIEAIQARGLGLRVAGLSCLTNWAAGMSPGEVSHEEVMLRGKTAVKELGPLVEAFLK